MRALTMNDFWRDIWEPAEKRVRAKELARLIRDENRWDMWECLNRVSRVEYEGCGVPVRDGRGKPVYRVRAKSRPLGDA